MSNFKKKEPWRQGKNGWKKGILSLIQGFVANPGRWPGRPTVTKGECRRL